MSATNDERDLAADLEPLADEASDDAPAPPLRALGELAIRAERMRDDGALDAGDLAALRFAALQLIADQPEWKQKELLSAFDDLAPDT